MSNPVKVLYDHIRDNHGIKIPECELEVIIDLAQKCPLVNIKQIKLTLNKLNYEKRI